MVTNEQLYQAIFHRRAVRKYDMTPLPADTLARLQQYVSSIKPLDEQIKYTIAYLSAGDVRNLFPVRAPHYICLYSERKGEYLMNAGLLLQQIDLYLSATNLGSCWLGMAKPLKHVPQEKDGLEFVIMLAFGQASVPVHRADTSEFQRKSLSAITDIPAAEDLLEPVRLAPSSNNTQPWFFSGQADTITVSRKQLNLLSAPIYSRLNQIDTGIALCHLYLSLAHQGKQTVSIDLTKAPAPAGYEFMATVEVG